MTTSNSQKKVNKVRWDYRVLVTDSDTYISPDITPKVSENTVPQYFTVVKAFYRTAREIGDLDLDNLPSDIDTYLRKNPEYMEIHHIEHIPPYSENALSLAELSEEFSSRQKAFSKPLIYASTFYPVLLYFSSKETK